MNVIPSTGINFGFQATDVLSNSGALVSSVAGFILLGLAIAFAPRLVTFIRSVFNGARH